MRVRTVRWFGVIFLAIQSTAYGQAFVNLDFERAQMFGPFQDWGYISAEHAFSGWTVQATNHLQATPVIMYNAWSLGSPAAMLFGPEALGATYSAMLQFPDLWRALDGPPSLSQIGVIPEDAKSIVFTLYADSGYGRLTLDGVRIPLVDTDFVLEPFVAIRMAGDVSAFAGRTIELKFTLATDLPPQPSGSPYFWFDDISFSTTPIPEPNNFCLVSLGVLLLRWRWRTSAVIGNPVKSDFVSRKGSHP